MLPDSHLKEIIEHYWDAKEKKVHDYDFREEALMAQMILDLRLIYKSTKKKTLPPPPPPKLTPGERWTK